MTTYNLNQWCDFSRGLIAPEPAEPMRAQLARSGRARHLVRRFERVAAVGHKDRTLSPPEYAVRVAKAAGSLRRPGSERLVRHPLAILFDSALQAFPAAGTRDLHSSHQQIVYRANDYTVEIRLEKETNPHSQVVVGQVLRHRGEAQPVPQIPVLVLSDGHVVGRDLTSRFGEFEAAGLPNEPLKLCLLVDKEERIDVPLSAAGLER